MSVSPEVIGGLATMIGLSRRPGHLENYRARREAQREAETEQRRQEQAAPRRVRKTVRIYP